MFYQEYQDKRGQWWHRQSPNEEWHCGRIPESERCAESEHDAGIDCMEGGWDGHKNAY